MLNDTDRKWMEFAIALADNCRAEGGTQKPKVGAVAVDAEGNKIAAAYRGQDNPGAHAEYLLLERDLAGKGPLNWVTVYTTLEPCTRRGKVEKGKDKIPCVRRLVERGVSRVVIGMLDPNLDVWGHGVRELGLAEIDISFADEDIKRRIRDQNAEFIASLRRAGGRPYPKYIVEHFCETQWPSNSPLVPAVQQFVYQYWRRTLGVDRPEELHILEISGEKDVRPLIRNSRRWLISRNARQWMLREIRRKAIAKPEVVTSKNLFLREIRKSSTSEFAVRPPIRPDNAESGIYHVATETGLVYELYEWVSDCQHYDSFDRSSGDRTKKLAQLLVAMETLPGRDILSGRFDWKHQYGHLDLDLDHAEELGDAVSRLYDNGVIYQAARVVADEVTKAVCRFIGKEAPIWKLVDGPPQRLVHGDLTETNVCLCNGEFYVFDWDVVRVQAGGPFDLAFALVRLARPKRLSTDLYIDKNQIKNAQGLLNAYIDAYYERTREQLDAHFSNEELAIAFEQLTAEFCLRMMEYFEVLLERRDQSPDLAYLARCNPGRVQMLKKVLCEDTS